jgi:CRISPR/Cas system-associated exonuclease Cas4 (RecB family)
MNSGAISGKRPLPRDDRFVSKSTFLNGLQCAKLLWFRYNAKDQIPPADEQTQAIFDQGHEVGELARTLYPDGIEIAHDVNAFEEGLALSRKALARRRPLFEAAFQFNGAYARADILNPVGQDQWDIIEIKSTTKVKDVHLHDLAFQAYVFNGAGLNIRRCFLAHINSDYVKRSPVDARKFFTLEDVTVQVAELSQTVESKLDEMFRTIRLSQHPDIKIGPHCDDPYTCALHEVCWEFLPESNVMTLYRGGAKGFKLLQDGVVHLKDISTEFALTNNQDIQRRAARTGQPHVDKAAIAAFLKQIKYPISFLDFETFGTAIPQFDGLQPFRQVPFQFSLHVVESEDDKPKHHKYLAAGVDDPRPEFMSQLRAALPARGSVVAFNAPFELGRLEECCELMPEFQAWLKNVRGRIVDLLLPFRGFRYYHPRQNGSASMKAVLPALTGKGYDHLAIQDGGMASLQYLRVTYGEASEAERTKVRRQLEEYCGMDTLGMHFMLESLRTLASR